VVVLGFVGVVDVVVGGGRVVVVVVACGSDVVVSEIGGTGDEVGGVAGGVNVHIADAQSPGVAACVTSTPGRFE